MNVVHLATFRCVAGNDNEPDCTAVGANAKRRIIIGLIG